MSSDGCCCLCCSRFDTVSSVKKRKLLHGPSASKELSILKSIIRTPFALPRGFLCVACQRKLLRVKSLEEELQSILEEINSKLSNVESTCKFHINYISDFMFIFQLMYLLVKDHQHH